MKYSTVILFLAVFGMASAAWVGAEEMCKPDGKEGKEEASAEESAKEAEEAGEIKCEDFAAMHFMMKGMEHYHESVCGTELDEDMKKGMEELENYKPDGCDVCDAAWNDGMGKCKPKGGAGSASASASEEASEASRLLLAEKFGIADELEMATPRVNRFLQDDCDEGSDEKAEDFKFSDLPAEQQEAMRMPFCAMMHLAGSMQGAMLKECKSNFEGQSDWTADHATQYEANRKEMHDACVDIGCKDVMGESCDAAMTAAGNAATWADIESSGSSAYIMSLSMLIAIIMTFFRY